MSKQATAKNFPMDMCNLRIFVPAFMRNGQ
jgi:hypothetical protein